MFVQYSLFFGGENIIAISLFFEANSKYVFIQVLKSIFSPFKYCLSEPYLPSKQMVNCFQTAHFVFSQFWF